MREGRHPWMMMLRACAHKLPEPQSSPLIVATRKIEVESTILPAIYSFDKFVKKKKRSWSRYYAVRIRSAGKVAGGRFLAPTQRTHRVVLP